MAKIDPDTRAAIERALRDPDDTRSRAQLGRDFGVHPTSIRRVALAAGIDLRFETAQTKAATSAARDHLKQRRARLAARLLDEAEQLLNQMHQEYRVFNFGGKDNTFNERTFDTPPVEVVRNMMTSFGIAIDKHVVLDKHDSDNGADDAVSMLGKLAAGLDAAATRLSGPTAPTGLDEPGEPVAGDD